LETEIKIKMKGSGVRG